jgi:hypothetical protein
MNAPTINPFRPTRWEHHSEGRPLIWFTPTAELLAGDKSAYVRGSRGSGKTSLLKSICWEDLTGNDSLRLQRGIADFRHIGIYIRFPDHISESLASANWSVIFPDSPNADWEFFRFFSFAIELTCAERALAACHELRLKEFLSFEANQETRLVEDLLNEFPTIHKFADRMPRTFMDLRSLFRTIVREMNRGVGQGTVPILTSKLPACEPTELLNFVIDRLSGVSRLRSTNGDVSPGFKFCLDDCEVLSNLQQLCTNTLVRKSRFPVSWVVSSVGTFLNSRDTLIAQQPLTDADRRVISLDDRAKEEFQSLCQAVSSLRLFFSASEVVRQRFNTKEIGSFFSLKNRLGFVDVNDIMGAIARKSTSTLSEAVTRTAQKVRESLWKSDDRYMKWFPPESNKLPFYETYILLHWQNREDAFATDFQIADEKRAPSLVRQMRTPRLEAWLRRKQQAALLHFSSKLGFKRLPIGGRNWILTLSDGSIRDFLEILAEIYDAYLKAHKSDPRDPDSLDRFASSRTAIALDIQTDGIYRASEVFFEGITNRADVDPDIIQRLIEGLGIYTSILQSNPHDPSVMGRAERGVFIIDFAIPDGNQTGSDHRVVWEAMKQAELAGYFRAINIRRHGTEVDLHLAPSTPAHRVLVYRLHRRLAPHFHFSFRGAYEPITISVENMALLCGQRGRITPKNWAESLSRMPTEPEDVQLVLPLEDTSDES